MPPIVMTLIVALCVAFNVLFTWLLLISIGLMFTSVPTFFLGILFLLAGFFTIRQFVKLSHASVNEALAKESIKGFMAPTKRPGEPALRLLSGINIPFYAYTLPLTYVCIGFSMVHGDKLELTIVMSMWMGYGVAVLFSYIGFRLMGGEWFYSFDRLLDRAYQMTRGNSATSIVAFSLLHDLKEASREWGTPLDTLIQLARPDFSICFCTDRLEKILRFLEDCYPCNKPDYLYFRHEQEYWAVGVEIYKILKLRKSPVISNSMFGKACPIDVRQREEERIKKARVRQHQYKTRLASAEVQSALIFFDVKHPRWDDEQIRFRAKHIANLGINVQVASSTLLDLEMASSTLADFYSNFGDLISMDCLKLDFE